MQHCRTLRGRRPRGGCDQRFCTPITRSYGALWRWGREGTPLTGCSGNRQETAIPRPRLGRGGGAASAHGTLIPPCHTRTRIAAARCVGIVDAVVGRAVRTGALHVVRADRG